MGRNFNDISNKKYNDLLVTNERKLIGKNLYWKCICKCGDICYVTSSDLNRGRKNFCENCNNSKSKKSILNILYKTYKNNAKIFNREFKLTLDDFEKLITNNCHYCNSEPSQILKKPGMKYSLIYNGIDRVENNLGYNKENCVTACKYCNMAKRNFKKDDFIKWIDRIKAK